MHWFMLVGYLVLSAVIQGWPDSAFWTLHSIITTSLAVGITLAYVWIWILALRGGGGDG